MTVDLIAIDGLSLDVPVSIANEHGAKVPQSNGLGKGDPVRTGLANARGSITVFFDAHSSHDPNEKPALVAPIISGESDSVMGSRMLVGNEELFDSILFRHACFQKGRSKYQPNSRRSCLYYFIKYAAVDLVMVTDRCVHPTVPC